MGLHFNPYPPTKCHLTSHNGESLMSFKNLGEALEFLKKHPILPYEEDIADKEYELYGDIIKFFIKNPDKECIPLIVNSHRHNSSPYIDSIIDFKFRQNPKWKHLLERRSDAEFRLSFIGINWDAKQAIKRGIILLL